MKIIRIFKLYLGNIKNIISTLLLGGCAAFCITTICEDSGNVDWKKSSLILLFWGICLSAASGVKDSSNDKNKVIVSFESANKTLISLCGLGGSGLLLGIISRLINKEDIFRYTFFILSGIIAVKTLIVEILRIKKC
jgi:hypothetical protein